MALQFGPDVSTTETDYGTVLLDQRSGNYWELNPTGSLVVKTLLDGGEEAAAIDALICEFDIDRARAQQDVTTLVRELRDAGLVS
ncbi:lasso peptide biosynthesis PqqD family chaperone [Streptomyces sp. WAC 01529]|uniref:lasso peptide biosynthesis PqqD family chaperone n=1 Tax=Streptomyces sp. WAC 01529 TaxID=2203205 RepID=UPI000F6EC882|nr:lasso peptide biosynthesis PqqD family chaperone [Streptomyces sp. WAC 01529]AZM51463.1 lasso peptide biosynthesis PqqD family chaperone [Streptomyces sp. WAC 01529]